MEAAKEVVTAISQLEQERADTVVWNTLYEDAVELAVKFEVRPSKPCNARKQRHRKHLSVLEEGDVSAIRGPQDC